LAAWKAAAASAWQDMTPSLHFMSACDRICSSILKTWKSEAVKQGLQRAYKIRSRAFTQARCTTQSTSDKCESAAADSSLICTCMEVATNASGCSPNAALCRLL
jgi:hypothetical protein